MTIKKATDKAVEAPTEIEVPIISLDEYIRDEKPHYGLVASFKYEASKTENGLADRTEVEWHLAFEEQSNKTYK